MRRPRARPALVAPALLALAALGVALATATWPDVPAPWTDPLPAHAVDAGYARFHRDRWLPSWPGWIDAWLDRAPPRPGGRLLVDALHATKQPWHQRLAMDAYGYGEQHGYARALDPLRAVGVPIVGVFGRWRAPAVGGAGAIFLNLVSGDNPALTDGEARTIEGFVRRGGGLVLVVDHTNCYFHAEVLQPLTSRLGVEILPVTACDAAPGRILSPTTRAWIRAKAEPGHPVTEGVEWLGMTTAGAMKPPPGWSVLAATSAEEGWADRWEPHRKEDSSGFTGDLVRDPEEAGGPVPVAVAGDHGAGRVVVLGDQNAWGSTTIGFEDNARLFANALAWTLRVDVPVDVRGPASVATLVGPWRSDCTSVSAWAFRTLQVQVARFAEATGTPESCTAREAPASRGIVLLPGPERGDVDAVLGEGRAALVVLDPRYPVTAQALATLGLGRGEDDPRHAEARWTVAPPAFAGHPLLVGEDPAFQAQPMAVTGPLEPWVVDALGRPVVARVSGRDVVLVLDADLLRNEALGGERDDPRDGDRRALPAHRLAARLLAWLFARAGGG